MSLPDNVARYKAIADDINSAIIFEYDIYNKLVDMNFQLNEDVPLVSSSFPANFAQTVNNESIRVMSFKINHDSSLDRTVKGLQQYILKNYGDVNQFLIDYGILVGEYFAIESGNVGFPIDPSNIG